MAGIIHVLRYGEHSKEELTDQEVARRLAEGLVRLATMLIDKETKFVGYEDFKPGDPDNTWVHFSLVTDEVISTISTPSQQFNAHLLIKSITNTDDFAGGITSSKVVP